MWSNDDDDDENSGFLHHVGKHFVEYSRVALIHGIRFLSRRTAFERLLWGIITLCLVLICLAQIIILYTKLIRAPVLVTFGTETKFVSETPFPAITICPETKTQQNLFSFQQCFAKLKRGEKLSEEEQKKYEYLYFICDHVLLKNATYDFKLNYFTDDFYNTLYQLKTNFSEMMFGCKWLDQKMNCSEIFTPIFTDEGICYSFNFLDKKHIFRDIAYTVKDLFLGSNKRNDWNLETGYQDFKKPLSAYPRRVLSAGIRHSLQLILMTYAKDYDFICKSFLQGFRVVIHTPYNIPKVEKNFIRVSPDRSIMVTIEPSITTTSSRVRRFHPRNRHCYMESEKTLKYFTTYTQSNCLLECLSNYTLLRCECVPFYLPRTKQIPVCGARNFKCTYDAEDELELVEIELHFFSNKTKAPTFCDCLPSCTHITYKVEVSSSTTHSTGVNEKLSDNIAKQRPIITELTLFFKHDYIVPIERNEVYSSMMLVCKVGCLLGLYTGASVITVIDFIYWWSARLICNKRLYNRWTEAPNL